MSDVTYEIQGTFSYELKLRLGFQVIQAALLRKVCWDEPSF